MPAVLLFIVPGLTEFSDVLQMPLVQLPLQRGQPPIALVLDVRDLIGVTGHQALNFWFESSDCLLL